MKVIGAGFGRTCTASLKAALEELGFGPCYHILRELAVALQQAVNGIGVTANARLEKIQRANIARTLAQDAPLANALDQRMASDMADAQITFQDRAGRNWDAEVYARMVLRTRVATTLNIDYVNKAIEFSSQYVQVFDGGPGTVDEPTTASELQA